ncbi:nucleolar and coiled-body phosphoprotein 1-like isoform X7 [Pogonomyrmex barbatus]|uniref:Nucleolar and coiled-body phosphoprotein 1-like isoform X7 n=1 Tax=Pogonomyrmex barbatus TaxID=144034 RepID=A0A6I9WZ64_9HYME|nr:nucleolar and coiled-body phosphoprotein 1-like isoform X7 [Pogonomyrmex barbatus]XP_025074115.1 nucleolar and coiled-body phosphoprotein 1-like isoform X7 [Pogonomyrmex barbatus]
MMVVSHRESSISSNIRAIIEQLNLNPVERRRLIDKTRQGSNARCKSFPDGIVEPQAPKITIGVYGCKDRSTEFEIPSPISKIAASRKIEIERSRSKAETRQRLSTQKRETITACQERKKEAPATPVKRESRVEHANEGKFECQPVVTIGCFVKDTSFKKDTSPNKDKNRVKTTVQPVQTWIPPKGQRAIKREHVARIDLGAIEDADASTVSIKPLYKTEDRLRSRQSDTGVRIHRAAREQPRVEDTVEITRPTKDTLDRTVPVAKEDLPELESASLNHTAAHHRISVRPKNRRPPRRMTPTTTPSNGAMPSSPSIPPTIVEDTLDSLEQQEQQQQQQPQPTSNASSPTEPPKTIGVTRKSSSRLSRNSDIFEELESRLPRKPSATSLSPDSLDATTASRSSAEMTAATEEQQQPEVRWMSVARRPSNRISKGSDMFEELEAKLPRRRSSSNRLSKSPDNLDSSPGCWFSKSTEESFDKLVEYEETAKPVASVRRQLLNPISKSTDRVSKSSDSLEAIEPLASDDSMERRRSSFDFRAHKSSKMMSKSSESFDMLEQSGYIEEVGQELQKRSSVSDINLSRGRRLSKSISKSSESFEKIDTSETKADDVEAELILEDDTPKTGVRRSSKRMSSESSDNLDVEDRLENRRVRRTPKRVPSTSVVDVVSGDDHEGEKRPIPTRKPSRLQKSSESSELGSTDTLDSERRNKSSESTETLDSLEKDLEQDRKEEEITDSVIDRREKNDSWSSRNIPATDSDQTSMGDDTEDSKSLISADNKYYWRQSSEPVSKDNLGIQQLFAITIMTRMADNGNNQRGSVIYPKKKQQMSTSQPTSPVAKQEDTKMLFDNLLVSNKNDEDLQNMLNGNISEVSTDTKSFKEKLIMFEKLGK